MSSQLKYGRDGLVYALHQLHRQPGFALIATLGRGQTFLRLRGWEYASYVKPLVMVRKDLRLGTEEKYVHAYYDFVGEIESILTTLEKGNRRRPKTFDENVGFEQGLQIRRAPSWIDQAAGDMSKTWRLRTNLRGVSGNKGHIEVEEALLAALETGKYGRHVHNRLKRRFNAQKRSTRGDWN